MRRLMVLGVCALSAPVLGACFPIHVTSSPAFSTRVIDAVSSAPISGATVTVSGEWVKAPKVIAVSDSDGRVTATKTRKLILYVVPMDIFPARSSFLFAAPGYEPHTLEVDPNGVRFSANSSGGYGWRTEAIEVDLKRDMLLRPNLNEPVRLTPAR